MNVQVIESFIAELEELQRKYQIRLVHGRDSIELWRFAQMNPPQLSIYITDEATP